MHLPSVDGLHGFVAAAQTLNFRRAARQVALTPAALSRRIQVLEELCGTQLFQRTTRSVALTEAGQRLLSSAREALAAVEACVAAARGAANPVAIELVVGTRPDLGLSWLFPQIHTVAVALPHVTLHLFFGATDDLYARLRTREIDCAVSSAGFADPLLDAISLHREDFVFVASTALLRRQPFTRTEHAAHHVLVDISPDLPLFQYWRHARGGGELPFARVQRFNSLAAIHQTVLAGRGVAVLPRYFVAHSLARGRLRRLFPRVRLLHDYFRLVYRRDDNRVSTFRALAATLAKQPLR
jgi:LysR family transcriptional regulator, glycine cleavage system transcriptional activator